MDHKIIPIDSQNNILRFDSEKIKILLIKLKTFLDQTDSNTGKVLALHVTGPSSISEPFRSDP